jgi:serine protease Do
MCKYIAFIFLSLSLSLTVHAKEGEIEIIAKKTKPAIVVIKSKGRSDGREALGTGFFISKDGLIVTNYHVIGEGKKITLETADGKEIDIDSVYAFDRENDLAILKAYNPSGTFLSISDSSTFQDGTSVVAVGNPQGLKHSVVSGVISGKREIDGREMLQVAIPIEPGNSGGPIVNLEGKVLGVLTIKSLVTNNLGFAIPTEQLNKLIKSTPVSIPMKAWATIGALNEDLWTPIFNGNWRQRAGRIISEGQGNGIGGRALLLSKIDPPALPFEAEVWVKLKDESGAAGLVFDSDGKDKHFGFYPSNGQIRLTKFNGPDVYSWQVLKQENLTSYLPGDWNHLKVSIHTKGFSTYLNGQLAYEHIEDFSSSKKVGLAKFRNTSAEFKGFHVSKKLSPVFADKDFTATFNKFLTKLENDKKEDQPLLEKIFKDENLIKSIINDKIKTLEKKMNDLKVIQADITHRSTLSQLNKTISKNPDFPILEAGFLIAKIDNPEIETSFYLDEINKMKLKVATKVKPDSNIDQKLKILSDFFFLEKGFHGSRQDYYHRSNSYLSEVMDDREGLPITLSLLFVELGKSIGLDIYGVGLPGQFMAGLKKGKEEFVLIDVFEGGKILSKEQASKKILEINGRTLVDDDFLPMTNKQILIRMLTNLSSIAKKEKDNISLIRYLDAIITIDENSHEERGNRIILLAQNNQIQKAINDIDYLLQKGPKELDTEKLNEFKQLLLNKSTSSKDN